VGDAESLCQGSSQLASSHQNDVLQYMSLSLSDHEAMLSKGWDWQSQKGLQMLSLIVLPALCAAACCGLYSMMLGVHSCH